MSNNRTVSDRKEDLTKSVTRRASNRRQKGIEKMRGIESTSEQTSKPLRISNRTSIFSSAKESTQWKKQQKMRELNRNRKEQQYKKKSVNVETAAPKSESKVTITFDKLNGRNGRNEVKNTRTRNSVKKATMETRKQPVGLRIRQNGQAKTARMVTNLRGIQKPNNEAHRARTINERFGNKTTTTTTTPRGRGRGRGRGAMNGRGRATSRKIVIKS